MQHNNISFTSNICFISGRKFRTLPKANYVDYYHHNPNIIKAPEFYSEGIRTCTGGGLVKPFVEGEGFHFWDDKTTLKNFHDQVVRLFRFVKEPERGLLVGGKEIQFNELSMPLFNKFRQAISEKVENLTVFAKHKFQYEQTHYKYEVENDTWTICTEFRANENAPLKSVKNLSDLKRCFEEISIAPGDRLFINEKEILPQTNPEIFRDVIL